MSMIEKNINDFFNLLEMDSDKNGEHFYKALISSSIYHFLDHQTKETAYEVYSAFFDIYRIKRNDGKSFIDLLDVMRKYEETAATLNDKQRDHYNHSVNVFILGLCIYSQNAFFREAFHAGDFDVENRHLYKTPHEEFLFSWGIAALFHDIGYPVEIINNQIKKYISFICHRKEKGMEINPYIAYFNFDKLNCINDNQVTETLMANGLDYNRPTDLLSYYFHNSFNIDLQTIKDKMDHFLLSMQKSGFVDHGFYSALIILKWYGMMLLQNIFPTGVLYNQILDSAAAIFLHNAYRHVLMKEPFSLGKISPYQHPIAFLLILCDEVQEWKREAYGIIDRDTVSVADSEIFIDDDCFKVHYIAKNGAFNESFALEKENLINTVTDINMIFKKGITMTATSHTEYLIDMIRESDQQVMPRLIIDNIEMLAKTIHEEHNKKQIENYPDKPLEYPTWESLPDMLKYSNVRQVKSIVEKVRLLHCYISDKDESGIKVTEFTNEEIEYLSKYEHASWVRERLEHGWKYDTIRDNEKKTTPYLVPYNELSEEIKELDRNTIRHIIPLLNSIDLHVYRQTT
ncbi:MAG: hypothetical protein JXQ23_00130 [Clostridia bacterium]|nr:hypothetical protein [Clostridia bacterium]